METSLKLFGILDLTIMANEKFVISTISLISEIEDGIRVTKAKSTLRSKILCVAAKVMLLKNTLT